MATVNTYVATLLTASATTGWFDWIHGELWLFDDGLLRIPLNLSITLDHQLGPTITLERAERRRFDAETFERLIIGRKHLWIPREHIRKAYLHHGIATDRLRLKLAGGRSVKLLWLPVDGALQPLQATLREWIGSDLIMD